MRRGGRREFVQQPLVFAQTQKRARDQWIGDLCGQSGFAGAPEFLFGTGQIELAQVELAQFEPRVGILFVRCDGILELDHGGLVIAGRDLGLGVVHERGTVLAAAGGQNSGAQDKHR